MPSQHLFYACPTLFQKMIVDIRQTVSTTVVATVDTKPMVSFIVVLIADINLMVSFTAQVMTKQQRSRKNQFQPIHVDIRQTVSTTVVATVDTKPMVSFIVVLIADINLMVSFTAQVIINCTRIFLANKGLQSISP